MNQDFYRMKGRTRVAIALTILALLHISGAGDADSTAREVILFLGGAALAGVVVTFVSEVLL